jgi:hypothetical protein
MDVSVPEDKGAVGSDTAGGILANDLAAFVNGNGLAKDLALRRHCKEMRVGPDSQ